MNLLNPFYTQVDFTNGSFEPYEKAKKCYLSDLKGFFYFKKKLQEELNKEDKLVYEVYSRQVPLEAGNLLHCITKIHPGNVGGEFYMTKGHFHQKLENAELYLCTAGRGVLNMQGIHGENSYINMTTGVWSYIPPGWGHRTINIDINKPFIFISVWPADSGYDYDRILEKGFSNIFVKDLNKKGYRVIRRK